MMKCKNAKSKKILKRTFVQQRKEYRRSKKCIDETKSIITKIWEFIEQIFGMKKGYANCSFSAETKQMDRNQVKDLLKIVGQKSSHVPRDFFKIVETPNMKPSAQTVPLSSKNEKRKSKNKEFCKNYLFKNKKFICLCTWSLKKEAYSLYIINTFITFAFFLYKYSVPIEKIRPKLFSGILNWEFLMIWKAYGG